MSIALFLSLLRNTLGVSMPGLPANLKVINKAISSDEAINPTVVRSANLIHLSC